MTAPSPRQQSSAWLVASPLRVGVEEKEWNILAFWRAAQGTGSYLMGFRVLTELAQFGCLQGSESKAGWEQPAAASESLQCHRRAGMAWCDCEKVPNLLLLPHKGEGHISNMLPFQKFPKRMVSVLPDLGSCRGARMLQMPAG